MAKWSSAAGGGGTPANFGTNSSVTTPPSGTGMLGWLSGLYNLLQTGLARVISSPASTSVDMGGGSGGTLITMRASGSGAAQAPAVTVTNLNAYRQLVLVITLNTAGTIGGPGQFILQGTADGGTTWYDICSPDTTAAGDTAGTEQYIAYASARQVASAAPSKTTAGSLATKTNGQGPFGSQLRIWEKVTGTWTVQPIYSAQIYLQS